MGSVLGLLVKIRNCPPVKIKSHYQRVQRRTVLEVNVFVFFKLFFLALPLLHVA